MNKFLEVKNKIQTKGYWKIKFYPRNFEKDRFPTEKLHSTVQSSITSLRGWSYPQYKRDYQGRQKTRNTNEGIKSWCDVGRFKDIWIFHREGLFAQNVALGEDWFEEEPEITSFYKGVESNKYLFILGAIYSFTEFILFIKSVIETLEIQEGFYLSVELINTEGRKLTFWDQTRYLSQEYSCDEEKVVLINRDFDYEELIVNHKGVIKEGLLNLFKMFNWDLVPESLIDDEVGKFLRREI
ncbi:hypothetical protein KO465_09710 [Candidatus Micrarchaeota archaeon]|jgi:hypothetical protein|nr:hypothetical protein [Candidatus Micrarchaeota archaeon]